ncbi:DUF2171 domain-containing protein [Sphingomonas sp. GCM10030256]|uniref:DUF2171 domain-containing protein n=1 Tax=Sphingomonas sp. GCM10030256 TaxID=3273427 RepID=UPI0036175615
MAQISGIKKRMEVIGADGVHVGTIDELEGDRLKLTRKDSGMGSHEGHHHYLPTSLVAGVEGNRVRLSATGANAFMFQQEEDENSARLISKGKHAGESRFKSSSSSSQHDWVYLGVAATALAGIAGATWWSRTRKTDAERFELQLQTDENILLISSTKVEGTPVVGRDGERLGRIENFMVDKYSGRVAYAVMSFGGMMGFGEHLFPLPWSYLTYDVDKDGYVLNLTKEQLANAPRFKQSEAPEFSTMYRRQLAKEHRRLNAE